jgi:peptidoglycan/xylan/chitin deacetylase (PgdA/CDA1 family)
MARIGNAVIRAGLETLYFTGGHRVARPFLSGIGAILTFHHVRPPRDDAFQPNRLLEITPAFLDRIISTLRDRGIDIVSLDEVHRRLTEGDFGRRFVALTFDDGYRDNVEFALPILRRQAVPFTVYVPSGFAEGRGELWWVVLERAIAGNSLIEFDLDDRTYRHECATPEAKSEAFGAIYWLLRNRPDEDDLRTVIRELAVAYHIDMAALCRELCLGWEELAELAQEPLATIGAHTVTHPMLRKASVEAARAEMKIGAERIAARLGKAPRHLSFPVGDAGAAGPREFALAAELGFLTAVTTRPGVLFADHGDHLRSLPRISMNGEFQRRRYLDVLLSGAPTALMNGFRRVDAA